MLGESARGPVNQCRHSVSTWLCVARSWTVLDTCSARGGGGGGGSVRRLNPFPSWQTTWDRHQVPRAFFARPSRPSLALGRGRVLPRCGRVPDLLSHSLGPARMAEHTSRSVVRRLSIVRQARTPTVQCKRRWASRWWMCPSPPWSSRSPRTLRVANTTVPGRAEAGLANRAGFF
jgi:hypothetical protein